MTDEIDIWRSAHGVIQRHGNLAEVIAVMRIEAMTKRGDHKGEAVWKRVLQAIKDLRRIARRTTQSLQ